MGPSISQCRTEVDKVLYLVWRHYFVDASQFGFHIESESVLGFQPA